MATYKTHRKWSTKAPLQRRKRSHTSPRFKKLSKDLQNIKRQNSNLRRTNRANKNDFLHGSGMKLQASATVVAGGAMAGFVEGMKPQLFGFATANVVGATLIGVGLATSETNITISSIASCLGSGMLASRAYGLGHSFAPKKINGAS